MHTRAATATNIRLAITFLLMIALFLAASVLAPNAVHAGKGTQTPTATKATVTPEPQYVPATCGSTGAFEAYVDNGDGTFTKSCWKKAPKKPIVIGRQH